MFPCGPSTMLLAFGAISTVPARRWLGAPAELHELPTAHGQFSLFSVFSHPEVECGPLRGPRDEYLLATLGRETNAHSVE